MSHKIKTSEPIVVSTSSGIKSKKITHKQQRGGGYQIRLKRNDAGNFTAQIKRLREAISAGTTYKPKKEHINIKNLNSYKEASEHIRKTLELLGSDASSEKDKLLNLKAKFESLSRGDMFYKFINNNTIPCTITHTHCGSVPSEMS